MKELDPTPQDHVAPVPNQHRQRSVGAWLVPRGCKVWVVNPETEEVEEVKPTMARVIDKDLGGNHSIKQTALKVEQNKNFYYCFAINKKNALRKFHKSKFYAAFRSRKQTPRNPS